MNFNFELILFYLVIISGVVALFDKLFFAKKRQRAAATTSSEVKLPLLIDYAYAFFPILLLVFLLRSFLYEPFRIPSGSLEPTLTIGDFILVNKFDYGIRLPISHNKLYKIGEPARGDIIVFRWPPNPSIDYIKRVIGIPGDRISYHRKTLYINGKEIPQTFIQNTTSVDESGNLSKVIEKQETLFGIKHAIFQSEDKPNDDFNDIVVPAGMYFAMGDNRDDSADSRFFGFVPEENIIGKAIVIWMNWNSTEKNIRWDRIGKKV